MVSSSFFNRRCMARLWAPELCLAALLVLLNAGKLRAQAASEWASLPDAPSALLAAAREDADSDGQRKPPPPAPCNPSPATQKASPTQPGTNLGSTQWLPPCEDPIQPVVNSGRVLPLNSSQKGMLAIRDVIDPFNLIVVVGSAGIAVAANAHSAYGPGFRGWGKLTGYNMVEDMQGEFFGTYLIPSVAHEDPRYHRLPGAPVRKRILHALLHTVVSQHDDGRAMLNYSTLLTYPISAELSNLYVPGIATNGPATARRIGVGLATDPAGNLIAEFLPDIARHVHIHVIFMQQILNEVANGAPNTM